MSKAATSPYMDSGKVSIDPCMKINCTGYNVTSFHVDIVWFTSSVHEPFSVLTAASSMYNTSDMLIVNDDIDFLLQQAQRLRIPESPIIRFPRQRNPNKWREEKGLAPILEEETRKRKTKLTASDFEFCDSEEAMTRGEKDILYSIITNLDWTRLVIICDVYTGLSFASDENPPEQATKHETMMLAEELSTTGIKFTILTINNTESHYLPYPGLSATYNLFNREELNVVLMCSLGCVRLILHEANNFDLTNDNKTSIRHDSKWLISNYGYDQDFLENSGITIDNIAALTGPSYHECYTTSIKQVLPYVIEAALEKIDDEPELEYSGHVTVDGYLKSEIISILKNPSIKTKPCIGTLLWKPGFTRAVSNIVQGTEIDYSAIFPNTKFGFNQRLFQVATLAWSPFMIKKEVNGSAEYSGLCMDLLLELAVSLNFTFKMVEPPDGEWGRFRDGEWTGLIGQVAKHESDMVLAAVTVSNEREAVMDFTFPYYFGYSVVFFRKPDPNSDKWYTLLAPFSWQVLLCIFCSVLGVGVLLYYIECINPFYTALYPKRKKTSIQRTLWYLYGALLSHGGHTMPESASGRMLLSTWWLFCMVCAATYSGNLIAFLTVGTKKVPFNTLDEMVNSDYSWGYIQGSFLETLFKNSNLKTYQKVWEGVQKFSKDDPDHLHPDMNVHFDRMMNSEYAVIDDGSAIFSWSEQQCDINILNERFFPNHYALGLPNNSPFTGIFSDQMIKIYESGLLQIWEQNWWPKEKFCGGSLTNNSEPIDLLSLQSAFYVLGIGVFLALSMLGIEYLRQTFCLKKKKSNGLAPSEKLSEGF
ncbi:hypothetical protein LOTGIDRAFT_166867 [Lottia gigantea]|uniref:Ionotropic glutamate receptor C-terminal domain-containing protein n=1 Tax=Lottia gigantea TaxID=225164 RepID=V3ZWB4_LOTGI|nr:hypothetical protein LOTGIDRAFT_166867 [Lottia gigantea]ESO86865.1 hypothetical protein LOTGIDRAFT_166867 [Lottia gigantea]